MISIDWKLQAEPDFIGFHVYRRTVPDGDFCLLNTDPTDDRFYSDSNVTPGVAYEYMIRTVKAEQSGSGSYRNLSQGVLIATNTPDAAADGPEMNLLFDGKPVTNDSAGNAAHGTLFAPSAIHTFTIVNPSEEELLFEAEVPVSVVGLDANQFRVEGIDVSAIPPRGKISFSVHYVPTNSNRHRATLQISTNDADEGVFAVNLEGSGLAHPESYDEWLQVFPAMNDEMTERNADPDGDGVNNFSEYAFGGDPLTPDAEAILPIVERLESPSEDVAVFRMRYRQRIDSSGSEIEGILGDEYSLRDVHYLLETLRNDSWHRNKNARIRVEIESIVDDAGFARITSRLETAAIDLGVDQIRMRAGELPVEENYDSWIDKHGEDRRILAWNRDNDGDGLNNLLEYAFGGDPFVPDPPDIGRPIISLREQAESDQQIIEITVRHLEDQPGNLGEGIPGFDYRVRDLRYIVEVSWNLSGWLHPAFVLSGLTTTVENGDGTISATATVRDPSSFQSYGQIYARIRVSLGDKEAGGSIDF